MAKLAATFPSLWDIALTGKCKVWRIEVHETAEGHGLIRVEYGYEDGKKTVNEKVVDKGKNIGKKNETTPVQQAVVEARATWSKKKDAGYKESAGGAGAVGGGAAGGFCGLWRRGSRLSGQGHPRRHPSTDARPRLPQAG
jgi:hypothetical protein